MSSNDASDPMATPSDAPKEKLHTIMEAASALTALGDSSDSEGSQNQSHQEEKGDQQQQGSSDTSNESSSTSVKRYIPEHKKPDAALTFPEKLMNMMKFAERNKGEKEYCIAWLPDGKSFVIRNPDIFTRRVLPRFFKATKFSSFTRKLYRWGFRQVNRGIGPDDPVIFGNEFFQRDNAELMAKMRSVTAASTRRAGSINDVSEVQDAVLADLTSRKRGLESAIAAEQEQRKRLLLESLIQEKAALGRSLAEQENPLLGANQSMLGNNQPMLGNNQSMLRNSQSMMSSLNENMNLASSFRTSTDMNASPNNVTTPPLNFQNMFPKHGLPLGGNNMMQNNASTLLQSNTNAMLHDNANGFMQNTPNNTSMFQTNLMQQSTMGSQPSSAEIVNAAINALRFAP